MKQRSWMVGLVMAATLAGVGTLSVGDVAAAGKRRVKAALSSYQENPSLSTPGRGAFDAFIDDHARVIDFALTYEGLSADATMSHIHFGSHDHNGGISVWLCGPQAPATRATCPQRAGTVTGTFGPSDVVGPAGQGIAAGEFDELVAAIRAGHTYVNVHTSAFPGGEIRGQINSVAEDHP